MRNTLAKKKQRIVFIDYLRVFSCLSVIMIHVLASARTVFPDHTMFEELLCKVLPYMMYYAVPVFFMITGYLFYSKEIKMSYGDFFKKYVLKYIVAVFVFGFGYAVLEEVFNKNYSLTMPFTALLNTLLGKTWAHMWYLYALVGVMLFIPIIKTLMDRGKESIRYVSLILLISSFLIPTINSLFNIKIGFDLIMVSPYLLYTILGYYIGNGCMRNIKKSKCIAGIVFSASIIALFEILATILNNDLASKFGIVGRYNSILILILSACLFTLFTNIRNDSMNKYIDKISGMSYGIYILHMFWINLFYKFFGFSIFGDFMLLKIVLIFSVTTILSYESTKLLKKVPLMKKII